MEQPREKALFYGINDLNNAELLSLILSFGTKNHSVLEVSYNLLTRFNGVKGIINASIDELKSVEGINNVKALKLKAAFTLYERSLVESSYLNLEIKGKYNIALYFRNLIKDLNQEKCFIAVVNKKNRIIYTKELFKGTSNKLDISPRIIVKEVINFGNRYFLIHNHPNNHIDPSFIDRVSTSNLEMLGYTMGVELVDHLIVTSSGFYSINDNKMSIFDN